MSDGALTITSTCHGCGLVTKMSGDDAVRVVKAIDAAHDVLRPECRETAARAAGGSPEGQPK